MNENESTERIMLSLRFLKKRVRPLQKKEIIINNNHVKKC